VAVARTLLAKLTNNLNHAGAGAIGLDILLSEPQVAGSGPGAGRRAAGGHSVIVDKIAAFPEGPRWGEPLLRWRKPRWRSVTRRPRSMWTAFGRRYPPRELTLDGSRWAFAVELARQMNPTRTAAFLASYGVPWADDSAAVTRAKPLLVPVPYRVGGFDTIPAYQALDGIDLARVRGRPVLVGFGSTEIGIV